MAATYSFQDTSANISGPFLSAALANGAGSSEEGISIEFDEPASFLHRGADGSVAYAMNAVNSGIATINLLKTSPTNALLQAGYNAQHASSSFWGKNTITIQNVVTGDFYVCTQVAFEKQPANSYAKDMTNIVWRFTCGHITATLGSLL